MLSHTSLGSVGHSVQRKARVPCETHLLMLWHLSKGYQGALAFARELHPGRAKRMLMDFTVRAIFSRDCDPANISSTYTEVGQCPMRKMRVRCHQEWPLQVHQSGMDYREPRLAMHANRHRREGGRFSNDHCYSTVQ